MKRLPTIQQFAGGLVVLLTGVVLADHSRIAPWLPLPNLTTAPAHKATFLAYLLVGFLWLSPRIGRVVLAEGSSHGSLFKAFKSTHPILKLSFSICLLLVLFLGLEVFSYLWIEFEALSPPTLRISGYRVFKASPHYTDLFPNGGSPGEVTVTDRFGFICDHEVPIEKAPGTLRVFVTGGSAMFGAGQTMGLGYEKLHPYPSGAYTYRQSIAGALRDALQAANPALRVEVVNAAHNQKCLHQSLIHYLEAMSRFHPDYVVAMDGFNDLNGFLLDDSWEYWEDKYLRSFVDLDDQERGAVSSSWTRQLAARTFTRLHNKRTSAESANHDGPPKSEEQLHKEYEAQRPAFVQHAQRWLQTFRHYAAVVREDDVGFVFAIQPMVSRGVRNKKLSAIEKRFDDFVVPRASEPPWANILLLRFFFDEYLSDELERLTTEKGGIYCDVGKSIRGLDANVEFFTDYCHLTPEGNRIVAGLFAEKIQADLPAHQARASKTR